MAQSLYTVTLWTTTNIYNNSTDNLSHIIQFRRTSSLADPSTYSKSISVDAIIQENNKSYELVSNKVFDLEGTSAIDLNPYLQNLCDNLAFDPELSYNHTKVTIELAITCQTWERNGSIMQSIETFNYNLTPPSLTLYINILKPIISFTSIKQSNTNSTDSIWYNLIGNNPSSWNIDYNYYKISGQCVINNENDEDQKITSVKIKISGANSYIIDSTPQLQSYDFTDIIKSYSENNLTNALEYEIEDSYGQTIKDKIVFKLPAQNRPYGIFSQKNSTLDVDILKGTITLSGIYDINPNIHLMSIDIYEIDKLIYSYSFSNNISNYEYYKSQYKNNQEYTVLSSDQIYEWDNDLLKWNKMTEQTQIPIRTLYYVKQNENPLNINNNTHKFTIDIDYMCPKEKLSTEYFYAIITDDNPSNPRTYRTSEFYIYGEPGFVYNETQAEFNIPLIINQGGTLKPYRYVDISDYIAVVSNKSYTFLLSIILNAVPEGMSLLYTNNTTRQLPNGSGGYTSTSGDNDKTTEWNHCEGLVIRRRSGYSEDQGDFTLDASVFLFGKNKIAYNYINGTKLGLNLATGAGVATGYNYTTNNNRHYHHDGWLGWKILDLNTLSNIPSLPHITSGTTTPTGTASEGDIYFKYS